MVNGSLTDKVNEVSSFPPPPPPPIPCFSSSSPSSANEESVNNKNKSDKVKEKTAMLNSSVSPSSVPPPPPYTSRKKNAFIPFSPPPPPPPSSPPHLHNSSAPPNATNLISNNNNINKHEAKENEKTKEKRKSICLLDMSVNEQSVHAHTPLISPASVCTQLDEENNKNCENENSNKCNDDGNEVHNVNNTSYEKNSNSASEEKEEKNEHVFNLEKEKERNSQIEEKGKEEKSKQKTIVNERSDEGNNTSDINEGETEKKKRKRKKEEKGKKEEEHDEVQKEKEEEEGEKEEKKKEEKKEENDGEDEERKDDKQNERKRKNCSDEEDENKTIHFSKTKRRKVCRNFFSDILQTVWGFLSFENLFVGKKKKKKNFTFSLFSPTQKFLNLPNLADAHKGECRVIFSSSESCGRAKNLLECRNPKNVNFVDCEGKKKDIIFNLLQQNNKHVDINTNDIPSSPPPPSLNNRRNEEENVNSNSNINMCTNILNLKKKEEVDGWMTARRRTHGHDFSIIQLAFPCRVYGICIDTSNFAFDLPKRISVEAAYLPTLENQLMMSGCADFRRVGTFGHSFDFSSIEKIEKKMENLLKKNQTNWIEILPAAAVYCTDLYQKNYFELSEESTQKTFTHLRLNLFPDGGVARLRVYGEIQCNLQEELETGEQFDLQAEEKGASIILYSSLKFGHPKNLLKKNIPRSKLDGWQTPRSENRPCIFYRNFFDFKNFEFVIIKLAHRGIVDEVHIDSSIFTDEAPQKIAIEFLDRPDIFALDYMQQQSLFLEEEEKAKEEFEWREIVQVPMDSAEIKKINLNGNADPLSIEERTATHVKLLLFPDGGIGRIKILGRIFDPLRAF